MTLQGNSMNQVDLDHLGIIEGTNKSSIWADYLRHYDSIFKEFRHQNICVLEIGVETGASLRMWENYFDKATIVGIDISVKCKLHESDRIRIVTGSQDDPNFLDTVSRNYSPTIIIDDASHKPEHVMFTFERLFPSLLAGGVYVIEDLKGHFPEGELRRGPHGISPVISLTEWAQWLMSGRIGKGENYGISKYLFSAIDSLQFVSGAAIVRKKGLSVELSAKLAETERLLEGSANSWSWNWFAAFVLKYRGPIALAEKAARKAVEMAPEVSHHYRRLSTVLEQKGNLSGAIEESQRAVDLAIGTAMHAGFKANLNRLLEMKAHSAPDRPAS